MAKVLKEKVLKENQEDSAPVSPSGSIKAVIDGGRSNGVKPDVAGLMAEIRARIKSETERNKDRLPQFKPKDPNVDSRAVYPAGFLLGSDDLLYVNRNYQYSFRSRGPAFTSRLPGVLGKIVSKIKTKFILFREFLWRDYIESEKEFNAHLVRYLNDIGKYVDERDGACFWELVHKIDYDVTKALDRIERINDEQSASLRTAERSFHDEQNKALQDIRLALQELQTASNKQHVKVAELDSVSQGFEAILNGIKPSKDPVKEVELRQFPALDYSYVLLENRFRGSEAEIAKRQEVYLPYLKDSSKPILEIGGGRGELQALLRNNGLSSYSVDIDAAMVELNKSKGLDARLGDGIAHLADLPDDSLSAVVAIQVLEHLDKNTIENLFKLCQKKLVSGGKVIFETINPKSVLALSSNYFRDPTHVFPLHPETLAFVAELGGLKVNEVKMLSPVPEEAKLKQLKVEDYMTPRWAFTIERLNLNINQLNDLLYGYQDYCIIAEKK